MGHTAYTGEARYPGFAAADVIAVANDLAFVDPNGHYTTGSVRTDLLPVGEFACNVNSTGKAAGTIPIEVYAGTGAWILRLNNGVDADKLTKVGQKAYCSGKRHAGATSAGRSFTGFVVGFEDPGPKTKVLVRVYPFLTF